MPEVEKALTVVPESWFGNKGIVRVGDAHIKAGSQFISRDFFNVFTCPVVDGDVSTLFRDNQTIGISNELALKLFHTTDNVIGKTLAWDHGDFSGSYNIGILF